MGKFTPEQNQEMREETKKFFIEIAKNFKD